MSDSVPSSVQEERWQTKIRSLRDGIIHIYDTKEFSDVQFTLGPRTFKAHRLILGARSEVFSKMLLDNPTEGPIPITGVSEDGFEMLLRFIYTDELGEIDEDKWIVLLDVCRAAKKFKVDDLLKKCDEFIKEREITANNVCTILNETADIELLKTRCLEFIKNNTASCLASDGFLQSTQGTLRTILGTGYFDHISPKMRLDRVVCWAGNVLFTADAEWKYQDIRELLLPEEFERVKPSPLNSEVPLISMLGLHKLTTDDLDDVMDEYDGLITEVEYGKLARYSRKPTANSRLPEWCTRN